MFISLPLVSAFITSLLFLRSFGQPYDLKPSRSVSVTLRHDVKDLAFRNALQERSDRASTSTSLPLTCFRLIKFEKINPLKMESSVRALTALYSYLYASAIGSVSGFLDFPFIQCFQSVALQLRAEYSEASRNLLASGTDQKCC